MYILVYEYWISVSYLLRKRPLRARLPLFLFPVNSTFKKYIHIQPLLLQPASTLILVPVISGLRGSSASWQFCLYLSSLQIIPHTQNQVRFYWTEECWDSEKTLKSFSSLFLYVWSPMISRTASNTHFCGFISTTCSFSHLTLTMLTSSCLWTAIRI